MISYRGFRINAAAIPADDLYSGMLLQPSCCGGRLTIAFLAHRIAAHFNAMSVVNETVENAVSGRGVADLLVPAGHRQLRSQNRRTGLITVFADFPEVASFSFGERSHRPVVDNQHVNAAQAHQQTAQAAIGTRAGKIAEQRGGPQIERGINVQRRFACGNYSGLIVKTIPGTANSVRLPARNQATAVMAVLEVASESVMRGREIAWHNASRSAGP